MNGYISSSLRNKTERNKTVEKFGFFMSCNAHLSLPSTSDRVANGKITRELETALQPAFTDERVADWLFTRHEEAFHPGGDRLTPVTIGQGIALHLSHDATHDFERARGLLDQREGVEYWDDHGRVADSKTTSLVHFTPAAVSSGYLLGYVLATGEARDAKNHPFGALPGVPGLDGVRAEFHGRFVYDVRVKHLVFTLVGLGSSTVGIVSFRDIGSGVRQRSFFSVPSLSYSTNHLPSNAFGAVFATEFRVDVDKTNSNDAHFWDLNTAFVRNTTRTNGSARSLMETGTSVMESEQQRHINLTKMDIPFAVATIQHHLFGTFYAPNIALEIMQPQSLSTQRVANGQLHSVLMVADAATRSAFREITVQRYYSAGLSLVSENLTQPNDSTPPSPGNNARNDCITDNFNARLSNISCDLLTPAETLLTPETVTEVLNDELTLPSSSMGPNVVNGAHVSFLSDSLDDLGSQKLFDNAPTANNEVLNTPYLDDSRIDAMIEESLVDCDSTNLNGILELTEQQNDSVCGLPVPGHTMENSNLSPENATREENQVSTIERKNDTMQRVNVSGGCKMVALEGATRMGNKEVSHYEKGRQAVRLLPRPTTSSENNSTFVEGEVTEKDEEARRLARIEHRKLQNRLSSARRNAKVKQKYDNQKKEIDALRHKAATLRAQQRNLQMENDALRTQLAPKSSSASTAPTKTGKTK